jgi:acyl-CoA synthetase (AMP-forming)/AMP-acid ligase II
MLIQNLLNLLLRAAEHPSGNGLTFHHSNSKRNPSSISYKALLELIEQRSMQLQEVESIDTKVVLIYFTDNLDSIIWFWTVVAAGGIPCICPPLAKDLDQRQNYVRYLLDLLERPLVITTWSLSLEFLAVEGLRVVTIGTLEAFLVCAHATVLHYLLLNNIPRLKDQS